MIGTLDGIDNYMMENSEGANMFVERKDSRHFGGKQVCLDRNYLACSDRRFKSKDLSEMKLGLILSS